MSFDKRMTNRGNTSHRGEKSRLFLNARKKRGGITYTRKNEAKGILSRGKKRKREFREGNEFVSRLAKKEKTFHKKESVCEKHLSIEEEIKNRSPSYTVRAIRSVEKKRGFRSKEKETQENHLTKEMKGEKAVVHVRVLGKRSLGSWVPRHGRHGEIFHRREKKGGGKGGRGSLEPPREIKTPHFQKTRAS